MKHIKQDFSLKASVQSLRVDFGGGHRKKVYCFEVDKTFLEYGHVAYLKADDDAATW